MQKGARSLRIDVCNYKNEAVCCLYDNHTDLSGQATDVFVRTERNGWKELNFKIPTTYFTGEGIEENYRLQYLIADYRLKLQTDTETDYYIISEPRIVHNGKGKNVEVTAGHISQLLKTKNLNLEFSDAEGNNVGTAEQLLTTILEGTGWSVGNVAEFLEDDKETIKVRSFTCGTKTGAFMMVSSMCEKFNAKPIYRGDTQTVDIVPMNPFSEVTDGEIPEEVLNGKQVLELNYGRNMTNVTRTLNTENLVTRLYAYGAYGDKTTGMCSLQNVTHTEYIFEVEDYPAETEFTFTDENGYRYYFVTHEALTSGTKLIWSDMDPVSRSYVWNDTDSVAIHNVSTVPSTETWVSLIPETKEVPNHVDFLMDFRYYDKIGLLANDMKDVLASYQRYIPDAIDEATSASIAYLDKENELSLLAESNTGFLRLDIGSYLTGDDGELILSIRKTNYADGVIYRSDYDEAKRNYFSWYCAEALKENGDPVSGIGSVVYIIHDTSPVTWEKAYIKAIDGEQKTMDYSAYNAVDPSSVTLWLTASKVATLKSTDRFYLFATNSISGRLGTRESEIESLQETLQQTTKVVTEQHPTYFVWDNDLAPSLDVVSSGYGWYYRAFSNDSIGELYFCYGVAGDTLWRRAYISETAPTVENSSYYFNLKTKKLYHGEGGQWVDIADSDIVISGPIPYHAPDAEAKRLSQSFSKVAYYCLRHDMLYKGIYDKYTYTPNANLVPGNYAFKNKYGFYWVFTTDLTISAGNSLWLDTIKYLVFQNENIEDVVTPEAKQYDAINFPTENELDGVSFASGSISTTTGAEENSTTHTRTGYLSAYGGVEYTYSMPASSFMAFYDANKRYLSYLNLNGTGTYTTPARTKYCRVFTGSEVTNSHYIQVSDWENKLFIKDTQYTILSPLTENGDKAGMHYLIKAFADTADAAYLTYLAAYKAAQEQVTSADTALKEILGDLYREGYWQNNEYVEGDEDKLYKDALDNLEKIAKPEATYDIQFLDTYSSNQEKGYSVIEEESPEWPDIQATDAVHLIDDEIDVNCWAFIDVLNKCYDQPWKTTLEVNTDLTLIAQHSFTDVLSRIADVANETKAKQTLYARAGALSGTGTLAANKLEGTIKTNQATFDGGSSSWHTDEKGNIIFESSDGQSAMKLTGYGFCLSSGKDANGDWIFRTFGTGNGMTADELVGGTIYGSQIYAGSIEAEQLHASVGQELEIGSNKALLLYATEDGFRPAGGIMTQVSNGDGTYHPVSTGDSYVHIGAKEGNNPAYVDIATGGLLNLYGSVMNLEAQSTMNLTSGDLNIEADGEIHMKSGSNLDVESGGSITVESGGDLDVASGGNLNVLSQGQITIASGGGIDIQSGSSFTVSSPNFTIDSNGNVTLIGTITADTGHIAGFTIAGERNQTDTDWLRQYMYAGGTTSVDSSAAGVYIGTDGVNFGGKFKYNLSRLAIEAESVTIGKQSTGSGTLLAINAQSGTIGILADAAIAISAGKSVTISSAGSVIIGNSGNPFTIGSNGTNAYIYNGMTSLSDTQHNGVYIGTDGIALGAGLFKVTNAGALTATSATITGAITAKTGKIGARNDGTGGWTIAADLISADNGQVAFSSSGDYRIYAGNSTPASAPFSVKNDGTLKSTIGTVGGWTIGTNSLSSSDNKVGMYNQGATDSEVAFWAGNATPANANFSVTHGGTLTAVGAELQQANVYGNIYAQSGNIGGTLSGGTITGGWSISSNQLHSGTGGTYVALDSGVGDYAIWAGADYPETVPPGASSGSTGNAPFRVKRDGTTYVTALNAVKEDGTTQTVNLSSYPLWKLNYSTIKSHTTTSITLTDGTTLNFNTASSIDPQWIGGALYVDVLNRSQQVVLRQQVASMGFDYTPTAIKYLLEHSSSHSMLLGIVDNYNGTEALVTTSIDASGVYTNGQNSMGLSLSGSTISVVESATPTTTATVSAGVNARYDSTRHEYELIGSAYVDNVFAGGSGDWSGTEAYDDGRSSMSITGASNIALTSSETGSTNPRNINIYHNSMVIATPQINVDSSAVYSAGKDVMGLSVSGSTISVAESNTKTAAVTAGVNSTYDTTRHEYQLVGSAYINDVFAGGSGGWSGTDAYEDGRSSMSITGASNISLTSSETGTTNPRNINIYHDNTVIATPQINVDASAVYAQGKAVMGLSVDGQTISVTESETTSVTLSTANVLTYSTTYHTYTASAGTYAGSTLIDSDTKVSGTEAYEAGQASMSVTGASNIALTSSETGSANPRTINVYHNSTVIATPEINIDASAVYSAGQDSVSVTKGTWSGGIISFEPSVGSGASSSVQLAQGSTSWGTGADKNTARVTVLDGQGNTGYTISVDASSRYNDGKSAMGLSISGSTVSVDESSVKSVTLSTVSALTYSTSTHKYTAVAGTYNGSTLMGSDSKTSGTEAYSDGQSSMSVTGASNIALTSSEIGSTNPKNINVYHDSVVIATPQINVDASAVYSAGQNSVNVTKGTWSGGIISFSPSAGSGSSSSVQLARGSTSWGTGANENTANVTILDGQGSTGYTISVDASSRYEAGQNSVTIDNGDIVRDGTDDYNATTHNTTIYIEATASNGNSGTQSFIVSGSNAYQDGQSSISVTGASNITLTSSETGSTNPRNINVYHDNTVIATPQINVDASAVYSAGQNSVNVTKGTWSGGVISFSPSAGTGLSATVQLAQGTTTWGTGDDANVATVSILDGQGGTGRNITVDASARYAAGQDNVGWRSTGYWVDGSRTITLTNDKTTSISIPSTATWSSAKVGDKLYSVTAIVGGRSLTSTIDTTGSYDAGVTAGEAEFTSVSVTPVGEAVMPVRYTGYRRGSQITGTNQGSAVGMRLYIDGTTPYPNALYTQGSSYTHYASGDYFSYYDVGSSDVLYKAGTAETYYQKQVKVGG